MMQSDMQPGQATPSITHRGLQCRRRPFPIVAMAALAAVFMSGWLAPGNAPGSTPASPASAAAAQSTPTTAPASDANTSSATPAAPANSPAVLPHIRINRENAWVDVDAKVVTRDGQWIELLVCTPGTREYEAILTTQARPSHLHLALMILAQTPGQPMSWSRQDDKIIPASPKGPKIDIFIRYMQDEKMVEIPAGRWVIDRQTNQPLPQSTWLFTGSKFVELEGQPVYLADVNGSCISLVNFGDDLLTRPTPLSNRDDGGNLAANTPIIPQVGTNVVLRLKPQTRPQAEKPAEQPPTTQPEPAATTQPTESQP